MKVCQVYIVLQVYIKLNETAVTHEVLLVYPAEQTGGCDGWQRCLEPLALFFVCGLPYLRYRSAIFAAGEPGKQVDIAGLFAEVIGHTTDQCVEYAVFHGWCFYRLYKYSKFTPNRSYFSFR